MIIRERLVERIEASGLSYSEIARQVGVKQPTITRLVSGNQYSTTRLTQLARTIHTTPEYLTGESDEPGPGSTPGAVLTPQDAEIIRLFGGLTPARRKMVHALLRDLAQLD